MAEVRHFPQAGLYAARENVARKIAPSEPPSVSSERYCVYNQTRERFVATGVEAVDASHSGAEARLRSLQPGAGTGLWIQPCPEVAPTSIRFPVDMIYLNDDGAVLVAIESFPLGGPAISSTIAGSLLVLPENTVREGEIHAGDRMILAAPDEMKRHLQIIKEAKATGQETSSNFLEQFLLPSSQNPRAGAADKSNAADGRPAPGVAAGIPPAPPEVSSPVIASPVTHASTSAISSPASPSSDPNAWKKKKQPKGWLARLLQGEPEDPRVASREALPGLIAYYFTGGTPVGQAVRDISPTGMYVVTEERWYPGTVVRMTLTDRHNPSNERSITVNAKAVRWGMDGVGLEFVFEEQDRPSLDARRMERANGMDRGEIDEFLRIYRST
jgi:hypothetical protein